MRLERIFDLSNELLERMEIAKKEASLIKIDQGNESFHFVHAGDKEYINPKILPLVDHCKIVQLTKFLRENEDVDKKILDKILSMNKTRFEVLIDVVKYVPFILDVVKDNKDEKFMSYLYIGNKMTEMEKGKML